MVFISHQGHPHGSSMDNPYLIADLLHGSVCVRGGMLSKGIMMKHGYPLENLESGAPLSKLGETISMDSQDVSGYRIGT